MCDVLVESFDGEVFDSVVGHSLNLLLVVVRDGQGKVRKDKHVAMALTHKDTDFSVEKNLQTSRQCCHSDALAIPIHFLDLN